MDQDTKQGLSEAEKSRIGQVAKDDAAQAEIEQLNDSISRPSSPVSGSDKLGRGFNPETPEDEGKQKGFKKARAKIKGFAKKHKKGLMIAGPIGGFGFIGMMFILFMLGSLLIPHFIENVTAQRFALTARAYRQANSQILAKKIALESADGETLKARESLNERLKKGAASVKTAVLLENYRPGAIVTNLQRSQKLVPKYEVRANKLAQALYGPKMTGIILNGKEIKLTDIKKWGVPFSSRGDANTLASVQLARDIDDALAVSMRTETTHAQILRTAVGAEILDRLGYKKFYAWSNKAKSYKGVEDRVASRELYREMRAVTTGKPIAGKPSLPANQKGVAEVTEESDEALKDDARVDQVVRTGNPDPGVIKKFTKVTAGSIVDTAIKAVSSLGAIGMTACSIVDGSTQSSAPAINANSEAAQKTFMYIASAADQQKAGDVAAEALGALTRKVNGSAVAQSNSQHPDGSGTSPAGTQSPYASAAGDFTILNVAFAKLTGDPESGTASSLNNVCNVVGSYEFAIGAGIAELAVGFVTGGGSTAAEKVAASGITRVITRYLADFGASLATKRTALKFVGQAGAEAGATFVARSIVANYSQQYYNASSSNLELVEEATAGAETLANEECRVAMGCAPMTSQDALQATSASRKENALTKTSMGPFERYFAISNPQSLLNHVGYSIIGSSSTPIVANFLTSATKLFNPLAIAGMFSKLTPSVSAATNANDASTYSYTRTVFGWTEAETSLVNTHKTYYDVTDNVEALDASGKYAEIEEKYGKCFTESIGDLLASGAITRKADGSPVFDKGLCSPQNLGPNNQEGFGDNVFRYRLAMRTDNALTMGGEIANPTDDPVSGGQTGVSPGPGKLLWPMEDAKGISDCFGSEAKRHQHRHAGLDMFAAAGSKIRAAADGKVVQAGEYGDYGSHYVVIEHTNGLGTGYGHMQSMTVHVGQTVKAGAIIGEEGSEGQSTGPHLHWNVFPGKWVGGDSKNVDPLRYVEIPKGVSNQWKCTGNGK